MRDQKNSVLLEGDHVTYASKVYKICRINYSNYGEPSKAVLGDNESELKNKKGEPFPIQGRELLLTDKSMPLTVITQHPPVNEIVYNRTELDTASLS